MNTRNWSIRSKITALLLVPLLALVVMWGFATVLTVPPAINLLNFRTTAADVSRPAEVLMTELQRERRLSLIYLGGSAQSLPELEEQRARTDDAASAFRRTAGAAEAQDAASELARDRIDEVFAALELLPSGRGFIDGRDLDRAGALGLYNGIIDAGFRTMESLADISDAELARDTRTLIALARARELLAQEDALVSSALVAGRFGDGEGGQVTQLIGTQRFLYADAVAALPAAARREYQQLTEEIQFGRLRAMEDLIATRPGGATTLPFTVEQWQAAIEPVMNDLRGFEVSQSDEVAARAEPVARSIVLRLALVGVLGMIAVVIAVLISVRIGRSLVVRLTGVRRAALDMAGERLPEVVRRLRQGEEIDVAAEVPPLEYGSDEIGQLGQAFNEVQLTAVRSAVDEADLRKGLSEVFLNIARRSQALLHRQLALLDKMERRTTEPDELQDLFRVDHLATRMRRHAEDLVILAGAAPGRGWRHPVPVIDVIRGAVSEVEDYARVNVSAVDEVAVIGRAVGDVIHLLAELIENATSFSPPHTRVSVAGQAVPNGLVVEIEDRGLGMPADALAEANDRLASPPEFDPANSARLGLFVVARLAHRHGVRVQLRPSPYGGVTAVVLIPAELVVAAQGQHAQLPAREQSGRPGRLRRSGGPPPEQVEPAGDTLLQLNRRARTVPRLGVMQRPALDVAAPAGPEVRPAEAPPVEVGPPEARPAGGPAGVPAHAEPARGTGPVVDGAVVEAGPARTGGAGQARTGGAAKARPAHPLSEDGLPRRIRQASLAPQLREPTAAVPEVTTEAPSSRTPEQIRSMMSAFQSGTRRGRTDGVQPPTARTGGDDGAPRAVPFRLSALANAGAGSIDVPFTGPLGAGGAAVDSAAEDWFHPSRRPAAAGPAASGDNAQQHTDPEEDA